MRMQTGPLSETLSYIRSNKDSEANTASSFRKSENTYLRFVLRNTVYVIKTVHRLL